MVSCGQEFDTCSLSSTESCHEGAPNQGRGTFLLLY